MFASSKFSEKLLGTFACFNVLHFVLSPVSAMHLNHQLNSNLGKYQKHWLNPLQSLVIFSGGKQKNYMLTKDQMLL